MKVAAKGLFAVALLSVVTFSGQAEALNLSPLPRVDMKDGVATVNVSNSDSSWRADIYTVEIKDDEEVLTPAKDIIVAPRIFKAPGSVRIATKSAPTGQKELFYRIKLTQQVPAATSGIVPRLSVSVPVVQAPKQPRVDFVCEGGKIINKGNVHVKAVDGKRIVYVLPGTARSVSAGATNAEGGDILCPGATAVEVQQGESGYVKNS